MPRPPLLLLAIALPLLAQAGPVYKWVDAQGQVHYGETPPAGMRPQSPDTLRPGVLLEAPAAPVANAATVSPPAAASAAPAESAKDKAKRCTDAKTRIAFLDSTPAVRILVPQKDGSQSRMTDEEHDAQMAAAQKIATEACGR